jgi:hypothetical protein
MSTTLRTVASGFVAVPTAFGGTHDSNVNALKIQLVPKVVIRHKPGEDVKQVVELEAITHRALIDFTAVDVSAIDYNRLQRDCDILKGALSTHRGEFEQVLKLVCSGTATPQMMKSAAASLANAGLTEQAFEEKDGGMIGLILAAVAIMLAAVAIMLAAGCGNDIVINEKEKPPPPPRQ